MSTTQNLSPLDSTLQTKFRSQYDLPEATTFEHYTDYKAEREGGFAYNNPKNWPPGPWSAEPFDKVVWQDPTTGLDCMMVRNRMGAWCGYVGVSTRHPWFGVDYNGCVNKHDQLSLDEKKAKRKQWLDDAEATYKTDPSELNKSALICAQLLYKPYIDNKLSSMAEMPEWNCTGYGDDARCDTPGGVLNVHGGLTYSGRCKGVICHPSPEPTFWFGFDCLHAWDLAPGNLTLSKEMSAKHPKDGLWDEHLTYSPTTGTDGDKDYKNVQYVKAEVESLAQQLVAITNAEAQSAEV